jgi:hypothetical protein
MRDYMIKDGYGAELRKGLWSRKTAAKQKRLSRLGKLYTRWLLLNSSIKLRPLAVYKILSAFHGAGE